MRQVPGAGDYVAHLHPPAVIVNDDTGADRSLLEGKELAEVGIETWLYPETGVNVPRNTPGITFQWTDPVPEDPAGVWRLRFISETQFSEVLCHTMLALRLPARAVAAYDEWMDLDFVDNFARLIPTDLEVQVEGRSRLMELHQRDNQALAIIESHGVVRTTEGPEVTVSGMSSWDAGQGVLARREQSARFSPTEPMNNPGVLSLTMIRV